MQFDKNAEKKRGSNAAESNETAPAQIERNTRRLNTKKSIKIDV